MGQFDRSALRFGSNATDHCSFCFNPRRVVKLLITGPAGVFICDGCAAVCNRLAADGLAAFPAKAAVEQLDTERLLSILEPMEAGLRGKASQLAWIVAVLRSRKVSWARIGKALNIARQSAWERFANSAKSSPVCRPSQAATFREKAARTR